MKSATGHTNKHGGSTKHAGSKKHRPSAKQKAAAKKWAAAGAHASHVHAVARHAGHAKPAKWSPGVDVACCAAEALAASLRLTGRPVSEADVLDLYWRTASDPDAGAGIWETIEAAAMYGLAGLRPVDARPAAVIDRGVLLGVDLAERHAVTVDGAGVWSWGAWWPLTRPLGADEAWAVTWP